MGNDRRALGLVCCAYVWWGSSAVFWRELSSIHPVDQLAFRICSSLALLLALAWLLRRRGGAEADRATGGVTASLFAPGALRTHLTRRHLAYGVGSAVAIGANWTLFLWAVGNGQAVEAALGYFLMPIVSIALGIGLLGERLRRLQVAAIALSMVGIAWTVVAVGRLPLIAVFVGGSFALYGLLRKQSPWDPISGLAFEIAVLAPIVVAVLSVRAAAGVAVAGDGRPATIVLLVCTGVITVVPLLAFSSAARRVPLSVLGLLQYVNPTLQFLVGWQVLGEPVSGTRLIGFGWIWLALALVITDELRSSPTPDGLAEGQVQGVDTAVGYGRLGCQPTGARPVTSTSHIDEGNRNARFEYRVWGKHTQACRLLAKMADEETRERVDDCYLLVDDTSFNAKVRDDTLKIKELISENKGFERWASSKHRSADDVPSPFDELYEQLNLDRAQTKKSFDLEKAIASLDPELGVRAVFVTKRRRLYRIGSLQAEVTNIKLTETGESLRTVAIEGDDVDELVALRKKLGLRDEPNIPVHQALDAEHSD